MERIYRSLACSGPRAVSTVRSEHVALQRLGDGVGATIATPRGAAVSNSGIVDLGDATLLFDTTLTPRAARDLDAAAVELTGRRPGMAANSHWHLDHLLGNSEFAALPIFATRRTLQILIEKRTELGGELTADALTRDIAELERSPGVSHDPQRADLASMHRWLLADAAFLRLTPPTRTFERRLRLPSERHAELISWGAGHTDSDAVLYLPDDGILFAGDLILSGNHPSLSSGDPEHWHEVLREIERLHPERIVPGHGPVSSAEVCGEFQEYLRAVERVAEAGDGFEVPERYRSWGFADGFETNIRFLRARRKR
jgi:cyclase